jgi:sugar phosphate isomerase/epimerase
MPPIAVQLYSFGRVADDDWPAIFERIAAIGITGIETVDVPGGDPAIARRWASEAGLAIASAHTHAAPGSTNTLDARIGRIAELGVTTVYTPSLAPVDLADAATIDRTAAYLDEVAALARRHGMTFGVHNHEHEMAEVAGKRAYQWLFARMDPAIVWEVDCYWATTGGVAPAGLIHELAGRVRAIHVKDGTGRREDPNVALGDGDVDIAGSVAAAVATPSVAWIIIEFDSCATDVTAAVDRSHAYLASLTR